ncbi:Protein of unknown function [Pyronema omphalodes CBS 100304]|uniref:Uncharacterized protein n=1 Tax=Pyronema omphalodes (strain CBS 100304) TaxID=1076935 RepID=U4LWF7_PYROM|nr:Protein of unknown function [Pyronema omphalodes CBS 100304]
MEDGHAFAEEIEEEEDEVTVMIRTLSHLNPRASKSADRLPFVVSPLIAVLYRFESFLRFFFNPFISFLCSNEIVWVWIWRSMARRSLNTPTGVSSSLQHWKRQRYSIPSLRVSGPRTEGGRAMRRIRPHLNLGNLAAAADDEEPFEQAFDDMKHQAVAAQASVPGVRPSFTASPAALLTTPPSSTRNQRPPPPPPSSKAW